MSLHEKLKLLFRAWKYRLRVERAEIAFLRQHLRTGQTCADVGAHKGAFTYWMQKQVGHQGKVYAFEPQPELAAYLARVKQGFGMEQVTVVHAAVSNRAGTSRLFRERSSTPSATLSEVGADSSASVEVPLETLDGYFSRPGRRPVDFIKCDVEGHELEAFQGAEAILTEDRPKLLFECEQRHLHGHSMRDVFEYLAGLGYQGWFFRRGELVPLEQFVPESNAAPGEPDYVYNFAFFPGDRPPSGQGSEPP